MTNPDELSLRDYFAAHVGSADLVAINDPSSQKDLLGEAFDLEWPVEKQIAFSMTMEAKMRYAYADAMMTERAK